MSLITELVARIQAIAEGLPTEAVRSGADHLETASQALAPVADGSSSTLPGQALAHFTEALTHLLNARDHLGRAHNLVLLYAATLQGEGWVVPPPRHHGNPFNARYEDWVRRENGGPPDREYLVIRGRDRAMFDAVRTDRRGDVLVHVLIDAKGKYAQFIDKTTGDFHSWWEHAQNSGLPKMLETALRHVRAGAGRPVEWWCAEREFAHLLNERFREDRRLLGRIRAVYRPKPQE
ncbi:Tox-REase-5 domain-containing protein [Rhizohabitans arisaemae]|uniref:Tox-REase-5 domain-containing protein n=1 Tax=Rhizohabitans arisaemae TaxID=2720610 RepID=UPI0024B0F732|nr:Tox-REase-5 domain-containing protein [Rhizohabitans arisaemae]